ncbi:hypothetical protein M569_00066 [Genlisea aurea]|uniref:Uncharacterized protein n=1 Tax=Genlisea aurea TaxID=192259 RepID=S8DAZ7_9LAMI|nr:hypothetical protein M569_00066 [Genlisea aurea]
MGTEPSYPEGMVAKKDGASRVETIERSFRERAKANNFLSESVSVDSIHGHSRRSLSKSSSWTMSAVECWNFAPPPLPARTSEPSYALLLELTRSKTRFPVTANNVTAADPPATSNKSDLSAIFTKEQLERLASLLKNNTDAANSYSSPSERPLAAAYTTVSQPYDKELHQIQEILEQLPTGATDHSCQKTIGVARKDRGLYILRHSFSAENQYFTSWITV